MPEVTPAAHAAALWVGLCLILMLVLWFCTGAGLLSGLVTAAVVLALGIVLLRGRSESAH